MAHIRDSLEFESVPTIGMVMIVLTVWIFVADIIVSWTLLSTGYSCGSKAFDGVRLLIFAWSELASA